MLQAFFSASVNVFVGAAAVASPDMTPRVVLPEVPEELSILEAPRLRR